MLDELGDAAAGAGIALLFDDERHVDRFLVHEQAVLLLSVIAEPLAVIGEENDGRSIVELV